MSNYIQISNQKILEIIEAHPTTSIVKELKKWKSSRNLKDYHTTLELLTSKLGLGIGMYPVFKDGKTAGRIPYINYYGYNIVNEEPRKEELIDLGNYHYNTEKCQYYLTKETIYKLMTIRNIESLLT